MRHNIRRLNFWQYRLSLPLKKALKIVKTTLSTRLQNTKFLRAKVINSISKNLSSKSAKIISQKIAKLSKTKILSNLKSPSSAYFDKTNEKIPRSNISQMFYKLPILKIAQNIFTTSPKLFFKQKTNKIVDISNILKEYTLGVSNEKKSFALPINSNNKFYTKSNCNLGILKKTSSNIIQKPDIKINIQGNMIGQQEFLDELCNEISNAIIKELSVC